MSALPDSGSEYGINTYCYGGRDGRAFRVLSIPLTTDNGYINQLLEELKRLFPPETIIPPNTQKPFSSPITFASHFEKTGGILYAPKKTVPTWVSDDATRYLEINVDKNRVTIKHGRNKNLEALDAILLQTSLFSKIQAYLVENKYAETPEQAREIIKEKIAPLARTIAPLVRV